MAEEITGPMSLARAWSVILAVGLRPCTGALVVLVFAMSQGLWLAGVGATFAMALGTGLTVSLLATLAVTAKGVALRLAGSGQVTRVHRVIEAAGALIVLFLGATLFIASLGWG
jgi:nickel/cobalt exporter